MSIVIVAGAERFPASSTAGVVTISGSLGSRCHVEARSVYWDPLAFLSPVAASAPRPHQSTFEDGR